MKKDTTGHVNGRVARNHAIGDRGTADVHVDPAATILLSVVVRIRAIGV